MKQPSIFDGLTEEQANDLSVWAHFDKLVISKLMAQYSRQGYLWPHEFQDMWTYLFKHYGRHPTIDELQHWISPLHREGDSRERLEGYVQTALEWHELPTVDIIPINRLRVLADEINEVAIQLFKSSTRDKEDALDLNRGIREDIGRLIAIAALNTPFGENQ